MKLFFRQSGQGDPLIILHGLFGSSDNWYTLAKVFAQNYTVFLVDQRNHGQSAHSEDHNYALLTEDLRDFVAEHGINIAGQYLKTNETIGYVITDINKGYDEQVIAKLRAIEHTIKFRVLY